jgi:uncharacterized membrane protein YccC
VTTPAERRARFDATARLALRKGLRVAAVACTVFYVARYALDEPVAAVFGSLTAIALLGLADLGGEPAERARAYALSAGCGLALVALMTLVSRDTLAASALLLVVAFSVSFAGLLGRNVAAAGRAVILFAVVAAGIPAPVSMLDERLLGVALGGVLSLAGGLVLWPDHPAREWRRALAGALRAISGYAQALAEGAGADRLTARRSAAADAARAVAPLRASVAERPCGPTAIDRALSYVAHGAERLWTSLDRLGERAADPPLHPLTRGALGEVATALSSSAAALEGGGPAPDAAALAASRDHYRVASEEALEAALVEGEEPERLARRSDRSFVALHSMHVAGVVAVEAGVACGHVRRLAGEWNLTLRGALDRLRANFTPRSVAFQNSVRLGGAIALARGLAGAFDLQHGFWVAFATLTVLRTSASRTVVTGFQAFVGTLLGFLLSAALLLTVESDSTVYAVLLPFLVTAAMAAGAFGVLWGQVGFTLLIVVLFDLCSPAEWTLGLIRLEDVAVGASAGLAIGVLAWPRGATRQVARSLADALEAGGRYVAAVARWRLHPRTTAEPGSAPRSAAVNSALSAEDLIVAAATEGSADSDGPAWSRVLVSINGLWYEASMLASRRPDPTPPAAAKLVAALDGGVDRLEDGYAITARALRSGAEPHVLPKGLRTDRLGPPAAELARTARDGDAADRLGVVRLLRTRAWIAECGLELDRLDATIGALRGRERQAVE